MLHCVRPRSVQSIVRCQRASSFKPIPPHFSRRCRASGLVHLLTVVCLVVTAVVSLSDLHALAGMILVAAVMMITFVCPFILLILQRSKVRSHGARFPALNVFVENAITQRWCRLSCKAPGTKRGQVTQQVRTRSNSLPFHSCRTLQATSFAKMTAPWQATAAARPGGERSPNRQPLSLPPAHRPAAASQQHRHPQQLSPVWL